MMDRDYELMALAAELASNDIDPAQVVGMYDGLVDYAIDWDVDARLSQCYAVTVFAASYIDAASATRRSRMRVDVPATCDKLGVLLTSELRSRGYRANVMVIPDDGATDVYGGPQTAAVAHLVDTSNIWDRVYVDGSMAGVVWQEVAQ